MAALLDERLAYWSADELAADGRWIYRLDEEQARILISAVRSGRCEGRDLLDYAPEDFDLSSIPAIIHDAFQQALGGRGIALVRGLPRQGVSEQEFELMTWMIGLAIGVARPQGKASQFLSAVRDTGADYRTTTGRGYNTRSDLDFHIDDGDVVALTCYNGAKKGGESLVVSSCRAHDIMLNERSDLLNELYALYDYNQQGEEAPGEPPFKSRPVFARVNGQIFCGFNRNRIQAAQNRPDVRRLTDIQREAMDYLDDIIRRPENLFSMTLEPGDMQILNNHVTLHSRTNFEDFEAAERKRLLFRLWLVPPRARELPSSLAAFCGAVAFNTLRGGIRGHFYGNQARDYEQRLARYHGLAIPESA